MVKYNSKLRTFLNYLSFKNIIKGFKYLIKNGPKALYRRMTDRSFTLGVSYSDWYKEHKASEEELKRQISETFSYEPVISLLVPTYKTPTKFLKEMIESVLNQTYKNLELCIADGSGGDKILEECIKSYMDKDNRIKLKILPKNLGISGNTNEALKLATGEYVGLFDHDDLLSPDCLYEVVKLLNMKKYDIIYTDEDKITAESKQHFDPAFKPDWSPDLFYSHNYITHFFVVKKEIIDKVNGFDSEYDGAQDYDIMFKCIENSKNIYHIPKILYHWRMHELSTAENPESKLYCYEAGRKAVSAHFKRVGINAKVECMKEWGMYHCIYEIKDNPLVSIIIPNKDHVNDLKKCINSLFNINEYKNIEIIIVENNSVKDETFNYYNELKNNNKNVKVITWKEDFNYSKINNFATKFADGEYFLFLNNDTEVINKEALSEMLSVCMRDDVGVVGAKLLYADNTIQHAGVVLGLGDYGGFAGHTYVGFDKDAPAYLNRPLINCNYSAVTAACMMVKRNLFEKVGGFTEDFKISLNDIDLCLKIRDLNKLVVYNAHSLWHHYESKSRGYENTSEKIERFKSEIALFQKLWKKYFDNGDPYYNINFDVSKGFNHL